MHLTPFSVHPSFLPPKPKPFLLFPSNPSHRRCPFPLLTLKFPPFASSSSSYSDPSSDDPPEAPEDTDHGFSRFYQIERHAARARKAEEEDFEKHRDTFLAAISEVEDAPEDDEAERSGFNEKSDDFFGEVDKAIALKRRDFVKQGLLKPNPRKDKLKKAEEELEPDEVNDLEEIEELRGLKKISNANGDGEGEEDEDVGDEEQDKVFDHAEEEGLDGNNAGQVIDSKDSSFDLDLDDFGKSKVRIVEPKFKMTLAELLDESKVVPVSVHGNLEVEITGMQHDSRLVSSGDLFVCCVGRDADGQLLLSEADKRGAVAVVASKEIDIEETLGCKALVVVEDTDAVLATLAASFYRHPSRHMSVIGITGTNGKTTACYLIKGMYEAMGLRTGMLSSVSYYLHGDNKLESTSITPDAVSVQNLMSRMVCNGTEAVIMEASHDSLSLGKCDEIDFDIAVFTDLKRDHLDFSGTDDEYRAAKAKLFSRMTDPERHRKIINIDDPNAPFFIAQGNNDVPVVTYAMDNKNADVHPLKYELSLFETQILVNTPQGILEISSGLLGRHNVYNILAAVAVGIAVGAPLEDIVRGIEEIDAVPGRFELIDEEQAFGVIVDHARTPDALSRLLDSVRELRPRRIITVIGCPGECERGKRPLMTKIATDKSEVTMLTSDNPKTEDPCVALYFELCKLNAARFLTLTNWLFFLSGHSRRHASWYRMVDAGLLETWRE